MKWFDNYFKWFWFSTEIRTNQQVEINGFSLETQYIWMLFGAWLISCMTWFQTIPDFFKIEFHCSRKTQPMSLFLIAYSFFVYYILIAREKTTFNLFEFRFVVFGMHFFNTNNQFPLESYLKQRICVTSYGLQKVIRNLPLIFSFFFHAFHFVDYYELFFFSFIIQ